MLIVPENRSYLNNSCLKDNDNSTMLATVIFFVAITFMKEEDTKCVG